MVLSNSVLLGLKMVLGIIEHVFNICVDITLYIYLQLHDSTGMLLSFPSTRIKIFIKCVMILVMLEVAYFFQMVQQLML